MAEETAPVTITETTETPKEESPAEEVTEATNEPAAAPQREGNTISVSLQRSPVFYANLTKRFLHGMRFRTHEGILGIFVL